MFARSAAPDTLQGRALQAANTKWGDADYRHFSGRESIGFAVCKKKYAPFLFPVVEEEKEEDDNSHNVTVQVQRMYGCRSHHALRKAVIEKHGEREGWEPFGQWSLQKAKEKARQETLRLRRQQQQQQKEEEEGLTESTSGGEEDEGETDQEDSTDASTMMMCGSTSSSSSSRLKRADHMCINGGCAWKVKSAYDNVYYEINGHTESEAEDNVEF